MTREEILREIKRSAESNGGIPPGSMRLRRDVGLRKADWYPKYWLRWGDALAEAGFSANAWQQRLPDEVLLQKLAALVAELGRFPLEGELRLRNQQDPAFPSHSTFARFGGKARLAARLADFCRDRPDLAQVASACSAIAPPVERTDLPRTRDVVVGFVYLSQFGRHYKIGKTNAAGRRERELAIQLPEKTRTIHVIKTDDPSGIEEYWHKRFADKRRGGEWFDLDAADVRAFKRRIFM